MKKYHLIPLALVAFVVLMSLPLEERDQATDSGETTLVIPAPLPVKEESITESTEIVSMQTQTEAAPAVGYTTIELPISMPPLSYSLLPQPDDDYFVSLFALASAGAPQSSPLNLGISTRIGGLLPDTECNNHGSIVSAPCTPSLIINPKSAPLFSIDAKDNYATYKSDCGSLQPNLNRHEEHAAVKEQCLGSINIDGENWSLGLWGSMTYHFDPDAEKIEITPCPGGDITECTALGIGFKVGIP